MPLLRAFVAACTMRVVSCGRSTMPLLRAFSATCTMRVVACGCVVARCRAHTLGKCRIVGMACRCTRVVTSAGLVAGCCSVVTILACNSGTFECTSVGHSIEHHVSIHASRRPPKRHLVCRSPSKRKGTPLHQCPPESTH